MEIEDADEKILEGYLDDLMFGAKTTVVSTTETENGVTSSKVIKRVTSPKDRLEYLRMRKPEQWKIPQPQPNVTISQNIINTGLEDLKNLLIMQ